MKDQKIKKSINFHTILLLLIVLLMTVCFLTLKIEINELQKEIHALKIEKSELYNKNISIQDQILKNDYWFNHVSELLIQNDQNANFYSNITSPQQKASDYIKNTESEIEIRNLKYLDNIQQYSSDFIIQYVSAEQNETMDNIIISAVKTLSDEICGAAASDTEKVNLIAMWVCENICYNSTAAETEITTDIISLETVMALKKTTCAGYSNIFSALCQAQGIYCINLRGGASESEDISSLPTNHEWNGVFCDGKWLFYDTTWASSNVFENGQAYYGTVNKTYLEMNFKEMSEYHRIDKIDFRYFAYAVSDFY